MGRSFRMVSLVASSVFVLAGCITAPPSSGLDAPPVGKELCNVEGISISRPPELNPFPPVIANADEDESNFPEAGGGLVSHYERNFFGWRRFDFETRGYTLPEILAHSTDVPHELIFGWPALPRGRYRVKVTSRGEDITNELLLIAVERTFGVKLTVTQKEVEILVVRKGPSWNDVGFKTGGSYFSLSYPESGKKDREHIAFEGATVSNLISECFKHMQPSPLVCDETGIDSKLQGEIQVDSDRGLAGVQEMLRGHGLELTLEKRTKRVLLIEKVDKKE
jgi:hypothetical protein